METGEGELVAPEVEAQSRGAGMWVLGLVLVGVVAIVGLLQFVDSVDDEEPIDPNAESVAATQTNLDEAALSIVGVPGGLLAFSPHDVGEPLPLWESTDGVEWTASVITIEGTERLHWFRIVEDRDGLSLSGDSFAGQEEFTSTDGVVWEAVEPDLLLPGDSQLFWRMSKSDEASVYLEVIGSSEIVEVLAEHTSVDLDGTPVCGAQTLPVADVRLSVELCSGNPITLTEDDVVSGRSVEEVFACLDVLGQIASASMQTNTFARVVRVDAESGSLEVLDGGPVPFFSIAGIALADGTALRARTGHNGPFDPESTDDAGLCEGFVEIESPGSAGVLVLDPDERSVTQLDPPDGVGSDEFWTVQFLGELVADGDSTPWVIASIDSTLWALDVDSGQWMELFEAPAFSAGEARPTFAPSTSGSRVYWVDTELTIVDLELDGDDISATAATVPIETATGEALTGGSILYATDSAIHYRIDFPVGPIFRIGPTVVDDE